MKNSPSHTRKDDQEEETYDFPQDNFYFTSAQNISHRYSPSHPRKIERIPNYQLPTKNSIAKSTVLATQQEMCTLELSRRSLRQSRPKSSSRKSPLGGQGDSLDVRVVQTQKLSLSRSTFSPHYQKNTFNPVRSRTWNQDQETGGYQISVIRAQDPIRNTQIQYSAEVGSEPENGLSLISENQDKKRLHTDRSATRYPSRSASTTNVLKLGTGMEDYLLSRGKAEEKIVEQSIVFTDRDQILDLTPLPEIQEKKKSDNARKVSNDRFSYYNKNKEEKIRNQRKVVAQRTKEYAQRFRKKNVVKKELVLLTNAKYVAKAVRIQMWWRVVRYKKHLKAIIDIQRVWRGCMGRIKAQVFRNCLNRFTYLSDVVYSIWRRDSDMQGVFRTLRQFRTDKQGILSISSNANQRSRFHQSLSLYMSYTEKAQRKKKKKRVKRQNRSCSPRLVRMNRNSSFYHISDSSNQEIEYQLKWSPSLSNLPKKQELHSQKNKEEVKETAHRFQLLAPQQSVFPGSLSPSPQQSENDIEKSTEKFHPLSQLPECEYEQERKETFSRFPEIMSPDSALQSPDNFEMSQRSRGEDQLMSNRFSQSSPVQPRKPVYYYGFLDKKDEEDSNVFILSNDSESSRRKEQATVDVNELGNLVMKLYEQNEKLVRAFQGSKAARESPSQANLASFSNALYQRILNNWKENSNLRSLSPNSFEIQSGHFNPHKIEESETCVNDIIQLLTSLSEENEQLLRKIDNLEIPGRRNGSTPDQKRNAERAVSEEQAVMHTQQSHENEKTLQMKNIADLSKSGTQLIHSFQSESEERSSYREEQNCTRCARMIAYTNQVKNVAQGLEKKLKAVKDNNIKTQREYLELQEIHAKLKSQLNKTAAQYLKSLEQEIRQLRKGNQNLRENLEKLKHQAQKQKQRLCRGIDGLRREKEKIEEEMGQLQKEQAKESRDLREQIMNLEQELADQKRSKERAEKREIELQEELKSERKKLETDLRNLSQDLERKHNDNSKYEEQMSYELKMSRVEKSKVELELREAQAEIERKQIALDEWKQQSARDIKEKEAAREKIEIIAHEAIELNQKSSQEIMKRDEAVKLKQKELETLRNELQVVSAQFQNAMGENVNLKNKCEAEIREKERLVEESAKIRETIRVQKEKLHLENLHLKNEISQNRIELMNQVKNQGEEMQKWRRKNAELQDRVEQEEKYFAQKLKDISEDYDQKILKLELNLQDTNVKLAHSVKHEDLGHGEELPVLEGEDRIIRMMRNSRFLERGEEFNERQRANLREWRLRYGRSFSFSSLRDLRRALLVEERVHENRVEEELQQIEEFKQDVGVGQSPPALSEVVSEVRSFRSTSLDHYQKNIHLIIKIQRMFRDKLLKRWIEEKEAREQMDRSMRKKECLIF